MDPKRIPKIAKLAYVRATAPKSGDLAASGEAFIGFDTEYDSRTGKLMCFQLAGNRGARWWRPPLSIPRLLKLCPSVSEGEKWVLVSYVSLAELQFLDVLENGRAFFQGARGSLDVELSDTLRVVDLARWFDGQSLAKAAESFGLKKHDYARDRISARCLREPKFREYALQDARLCFEIAELLSKELATHDISFLKTRTPAAAAATFWRKHFLEQKLDPPLRRVRWFAMRCSWGGRAEAFTRGNVEHVEEWDLKSAYPRACIALAKFPRARDWTDDPKGAIGGLVQVEFEFPRKVRFPVLPVFVDGCLVYPRSGVSFCTLREWQLARKLGARGTELEGYYFHDGDPSLSRCMRDLLRQREKAKGARRVTLKLFANALTGKFIQAVQAFSLDQEIELARKLKVDLRDIVLLQESEKIDLGLKPKLELGPCFLPEWYALITGYVRAELGAMLQSADPCYCATDAVWSRRKNFSWPGAEKKRDGRAYVARTRLAMLWKGDDRHVAFHSLANRTYARRALWLLAHGREPSKRYRFRHSVKVREAARRGEIPGRWESRERIASFEWDQKRLLLDNGESEPWNSAEEFIHARTQLFP